MLDIEKKIDNDPSSAGKLLAEEFNRLPGELQNTIKKYRDNPEQGYHQLAECLEIASKSQFYDDVGSANKIHLNKVVAPAQKTVMKDGIIFLFIANSTNTGNVTLTLGADGAPFPAKYKKGEIAAGAILKDELYLGQYKEVTNPETQDVEKWFEIRSVGGVKATEAEAIAGVDNNKYMTPATTSAKINDLVATEEDVLAGNPGKLATANQISSGGIDSGIGYTRDVQNCAMTCLDTVADALMLPQKLGFDNLLGRKIVLKYERSKLINPYITYRDYWLAKSGRYINATNNLIKAINYVYSYVVDIGDGVSVYFTPHFGPYTDKEPWSSPQGYGATKYVNTGFLFQDIVRVNRVPIKGNYSLKGNWDDSDLVYVGEITNVSIRRDASFLPATINGYTIKFKLPPVSGSLRRTSDTNYYHQVLIENIELSIEVNLGCAVDNQFIIKALDYKKMFNAYYSNEYNPLSTAIDEISTTFGSNPNFSTFAYENFKNAEVTFDSSEYNFGTIKVGLKCDVAKGVQSYSPGLNVLTQDPVFYSYASPQRNFYAYAFGNIYRNSSGDIYGAIKNHTDFKYTKYFSEIVSPVGYVLPSLDELKTRPWYDATLAFDNAGNVVNAPSYSNMAIQD